jgi:putative DNA primase/helicase
VEAFSSDFLPSALAPWVDDIATRLQCPPDYVGVAAITALDELISLLKHLDRDDQAVARRFYLSGWSGLDPYTFDRIGRGQRHIEAVCVSVLGTTQPVRISEYVRRANFGGAGGDGLMQRFGLMVWPDAPADWKNVDEFPQSAAREKAWQTFERASKLDISAALKLGAGKGEFDKIPSLCFADDAHEVFLEWRAELERRLRSDELSPALEGHLAKYRKLVPALALINHLSDNQDGGPVSREAIVRALAFSAYLETHARRVYRSSSEAELAAAKAILGHMKAGDLKDGFTARDVHQRDWAHLIEREQVGAGLELLVELGHLADLAAPPGPQGGRPTVTYRINPRGVR